MAEGGANTAFRINRRSPLKPPWPKTNGEGSTGDVARRVGCGLFAACGVRFADGHKHRIFSTRAKFRGLVRSFNLDDQR